MLTRREQKKKESHRMQQVRTAVSVGSLILQVLIALHLFA
jgi:hypothetical protein